MEGEGVNGCDSIVEIDLSFEIPSAIINPTLICPDAETGQVTIESIEGLDLPIAVTVDGIFFDNYSSIPVVIDLEQGPHEIMLSSAGCEYSENINIDEIDSTGLALNVVGTSTNSYQLSLVGTNFQNINWSSNADLSCLDCISTSVVISQNTFVDCGCNLWRELPI